MMEVQNNVQWTKKAKVVAIAGIIAITLAIGGFTYAFFVAGISNANKQEVSVRAGTLELTFKDANGGAVSDILSGVLQFDGEGLTKNFQIENNGTLDAYASVKFKEMVNGYLSGSLVYTLYQKK